MLDIRQKAAAGTMESSDAYVEIEPAEEGLKIRVESVVQQQFGAVIENAAQEVLQQYGVQKASVRIFDRGALDCVIRARVEPAILRGKGE
ncbi:MAG: citrate lyase acyl carrier protein [Clostridia bacterium]|nr:citrate lyase acyl carrier protein [Clostridia bacterium]